MWSWEDRGDCSVEKEMGGGIVKWIEDCVVMTLELIAMTELRGLW